MNRGIILKFLVWTGAYPGFNMERGSNIQRRSFCLFEYSRKRNLDRKRGSSELPEPPMYPFTRSGDNSLAEGPKPPDSLKITCADIY